MPELLFPRAVWRWKTRAYENAFCSLPVKAQAEIQSRVDYYCKADKPFRLPNAVSVAEFSDWKKSSYSIDIRRYLRVWRGHERFEYLFGDVRHVPQVPTFLKSRPISDDNANSVLLKLDQLRHYYFIPDSKSWREKKDAAVWRGVCHREHREQFVAKFFDSPLCDVGGTGGVGNPQHQKPFMSIPDQLDFKFVLSVEGHDVATNLKWIMAYNSLCVMARPKFETWYMEGTLEAGKHYVE
ncbi:MAG: glycosyl transferase family 90, partial [Gammaproteobacteria bacterium]|nr:glycosyl transferase family 90 [Gammaproteobacteria bacterium]